ncbi:NfeD family protein [Desulfonatronovibrio hydrogenovorans]|uniref:NfeD family protein n=1 Tax=Desulfonatronovibrio hydrogenovorans TaxID=53245 RepID=UPI00054E2DC2|nr:NfeD family protein [Desulfonatronovibrio hydrogenovorans]
MKPPVLYTLLQIPGFLLLGIIVRFVWDQAWISAWTGWLIVSAWIIKDIAFYPLYRKALKSSPQSVIARLHGSRAVVCTALDPKGQVTLRGEIWQAVNLNGDLLEPGTLVVVEDNTGLTLQVRPLKVDR